MTLDVFQLLCLPVLALAYAAELHRAPSAARRAAEILALAFAAFIGEATCIAAYRFYAYGEAWSVRLFEVPVLVPLIWPMVILSARALLAATWPGPMAIRRALAVGALVALDASLIEVVAVGAGYWRWSEGGYLGVPLIGVLGWAFFAFAASLWLDRARGAVALALLPIVAVAATHALLLASWWGALRWTLRGDFGSWPLLVVTVAAVALTVALAFAGGRPPRLTMLARIPAALLFVLLLATSEPIAAAGTRWTHVALVAVPYLLATLLALRPPRAIVPRTIE